MGEESLSLVTENFTMKMSSLAEKIYYSEKYNDVEYEYRHVIIPKEMVKMLPKNHLMTESEWRSLGIQQSQGWIHYMIHTPEPHILLFRRPLPEAQKKAAAAAATK